MAIPDSASAVPHAPSRAEVRRVVVSSFVGSMFEYYDFLLYGTAAALVFPKVFFTHLDPLTASIASFATLATGYAARPLGGLIFGHFGDRYGRKKALIVVMTMMGLASALIGLIPSAAAIGATAVVVLVLLRILQGIALGGEWGGAALMALEHSPDDKRGFLASFANAGGPAGSVLGALAMAAAAMLPEEQFLAWGWRLPFLASVILLAIGLYIRSRVSESPLYQELSAAHAGAAADRPPLFQVLRRPVTLITIMIACMGSFAVQNMISAFGLTYAKAGGVSNSGALTAFTVSQAIAVGTMLGWARLSDRLGRRPVMIGGLVGAAVFGYPLLAMVGSGDQVVATFGFIGLALCQSASFGPIAAFVAEQFATGSRYTGASLGFQLASLLGGGFTPLVLATIYAASGQSLGAAVAFVAGISVLSAATLFFGRETRHNSLRANVVGAPQPSVAT